jgi:transposase
MPKKAPEWLNNDIQEFYQTCQGRIKAIQRAILEKRGIEIAYMTITERMKRLGLERPRDKSKKATTDESAPQEATMTDEPVEVLPGQTSLDDTDTPAEVHYDAVGEFDALPAGYAKVIQPMRPYSDAEEWALNKSMELYGFIGTIVRDQYGRILDGNQRERVARLRGLAVPYTITQVRDDAHAIEIATSLNAVRRHYTPEQRQELAPILRDQGFSYRAIADALGVGKSTVYRDVFGQLSIRPEPMVDTEIVPNGTLPSVTNEPPTEGGHPDANDHAAIVPNGTMAEIDHAERDVVAPPASPPQRVKRKGGGTYPAQRPTDKKAPTHHTPLPDRQLAFVVDHLMRHAWMWPEKHWQALNSVIQKIDGTRQRGDHPLKRHDSSEEERRRWQSETRSPLDAVMSQTTEALDSEQKEGEVN